MAKKAYQPFYWGDYLRDTGQLSLLEHGAYLRLIGEYWNTGQALPLEERRLHRALGVDTNEEKGAIAFVLQRFFVLDGNMWRHKRLDADLAAHAEHARKASEAARVAAYARWENDAERMPDAMRFASDSQCGSHANQTKPNQTNTIPLHPVPTSIPNQNKEPVGKGGVGETQPLSGSLTSLKEGVVGKGFDIRLNLTPSILVRCERYAEGLGWDFFSLVKKYNAWCTENGLPSYPDKAFPAWLESFTGDKAPQ